eukprot:31653_1
MALASRNKYQEKKLVFEKVRFDPLSNPLVVDDATSPVNIDSGWDSDEKKEPLPTQTDRKSSDDQDTNHTTYTIDANIERAKKKKKKIDFRAEMTSDSQDIDDLLVFQSKEKNEKEQIKKIDEELLNVGDDDLLTIEQKKQNKDKKSLEDLLAETDQMFKTIEDKSTETTDKLDLDVDDNFNFEQYINQQDVDQLKD